MVVLLATPTNPVTVPANNVDHSGSFVALTRKTVLGAPIGNFFMEIAVSANNISPFE